MERKFRRVLIVTIVVTAFSVCKAVAFKDLSPEVDEAAEGFSNEGMFGSFLYQYGQDLFRPEGYVTRENLILILKEYHTLTMKLLSQNKQLLSEMNKLKTKGLSSKSMDLILQEFQKVLEPMLRNSKTIFALRKHIAEISVGSASTATGESINFQEEINALNEKVGNLAKLYSASREKPGKMVGLDSGSSKRIAIISDELNEIKSRITNLKKDMYMQKKQITGIAKEKADDTEFKHLQKEISNLNEKVESLVKLYSTSGEKPGKMVGLDSESSKGIIIILDDLKRIKDKVADLRKDIYMQKEQITGIAKEKADDTEFKHLQKEISNLNERVESLVKLYSTSGEKTGKMVGLDSESSKRIIIILDDLKRIKDRIADLNKDISMQKKQIAGISKTEKEAKSDSKTGYEIAGIKNNIKNLEQTIVRHQRYIEGISREKTFKSSGGSLIPFWVKVSIGFSTFALFFMAR